MPKVILSNNQKLFLLFSLALLFRIILTPLAVNGDIISQAAWGDWIYHNGFVGLFDANVWSVEWPNHPPLISMWYGVSYSMHGSIMGILTNIGSFIALHHLGANKILWYYQAVTWYGQQTYSTLPITYGAIITLKFLPILADLSLAFIVYKFAVKAKSKYPLLLTSLYFLLPFSWYLSSLWGQTDQLATLLLALAFFALYKKQFFVSPILFALGADLKPTILIFVPIYLTWLILKRGNLIHFFAGVIVSVGLLYYSVSVFTQKEAAFYFYDHLRGVLFDSKVPAATISAFNFWFIFFGNSRASEAGTFLLSYKIWGYLAFVVLNLFAIKISQKKDLRSLILSLFIVGFGGWLFLTNMYERYAFAGIFFGLLLAIQNPKLLKYWLVLSFIFLLDLYHGWWYPEWLPFFQGFLLWNDWFFARILSLINILIFFLICYQSIELILAKSKLLNFRRHFTIKLLP